MKIKVSTLQGIIREAILENHDLLLIEAPGDDIQTVGDLKALIDAAISKKRETKGKAAGKDLAKGILADLLPGGGTIAGAFGAFKAMYSMPDDKRTGTALDYLDVDDEVSAIVDDNVENKFLKAVVDSIENVDDNMRLKDFNMTKKLAKYIKQNFNARTVVGFDA